MAVDPTLFRSLMRRFPTGVTVMTVRDGTAIHGMTANSVTSVSLAPTLILVCVINGSTTMGMVTRVKKFGLNILSAEQRSRAERFAKQVPIPADPFADIPFHTEVTGSPIFDDCIAFLDCTVVAEHLAGDHTIYVGQVVAQGFGTSAGTPPLLWLDGKYKSG